MTQRESGTALKTPGANLTMPAIQCPGCRAHLSVRGLVNCPRCQAYLNPPHHQVAQTTPNRSAGTSPTTVFSFLALAAIVAGIVALAFSVVSPSAERVKGRLVTAALTQCQNAIRSAAQYGDAELPPYTANHGKDDEFYFAWPSGSFIFTNGFGGKVKMSASCTGSISNGKIEHLTLNGKDII